MSRRSWHNCTPPDLHALARDWFLAHRRIELQKLAAELGISRATAYRWAGSAGQLMGVVLGSLTDETFRQIESRTRHRGSDRIVEVLEAGMRYARQFEPLHRFLNQDPQTGLKLLASRHGPVQARTSANLQRLIETEIDAGHMHLSVTPQAMAYALTRIVESFLYADLITGQKPDTGSAREIVRLLLRPEPLHP